MATTPSSHSKASHLGGFESRREEVAAELPLQGELPSWLRGSLLRTGPALWEDGKLRLRHWFDGMAMLHRFDLGGKTVSYANRFLESRAYEAIKLDGQISFSEFATDPCRSLFGRVFSVFSPGVSDNANVNVAALGERLIAMTETPMPIEFDPDTLATAGVAYEAPGLLSTAHPHLDRATGGLLNYATKVGPRNKYRFFHLAPDSRKPVTIAEKQVDKPAYMHSFGLTEKWFVLAEFPLVVNPIQIPLSRRPYIENFRWEPERGTRVTFFSRSGDEVVGPIETDPCFAFHHINAYEEGNQVVVDVCAYEDASVISAFYMDRVRAGGTFPNPQLRRIRVDLDASSATIEPLLEDGALELPRIDYERCNERPYRYVWGVRNTGSGWLDSIVRVELEQGSTRTWSEPGCYPGEPVFVGAPERVEEGEGVVLSIVFDSRKETSFLVVLDASSLTELARAEAPHGIPFGFHAQFAAGLGREEEWE